MTAVVCGRPALYGGPAAGRTGQQLDPQRIFRATRQAIAAAHGVRHYTAAGKGRLVLTLAPDDETIAVTQERAGTFRDWWEMVHGGSGGGPRSLGMRKLWRAQKRLGFTSAKAQRPKGAVRCSQSVRVTQQTCFGDHQADFACAARDSIQRFLAPKARISTHRMQNTRPRATRADAAWRFARELEDLSRSDADYWSYKKMAQRPGLHGIARYPAMMVPRMQADVLDAAIKVLPTLTKVIDPFVGSGTTLVEAIRRRIAFEGFDINPLAILICRAKLLNIAPLALRRRIAALLQRLQDDRSRAIDVQFPGRDKWFSRTASVELSMIRRAICAEPSQATRRFFWAVLSETIRQTSLSRETTYKLHVRATDAIPLVRRPLHRFRELIGDALIRYCEHHRAVVCSSEDPIDASLHCRDIRQVGNMGGARAQFLLTSPPYGDNQSTIPYGQFSYLALSWIHPDDLEGSPDLYKTAYATDTASLGGSARNYTERAMTMAGVLPEFRSFFEELCHQGRPDLETKAAVFAADLFDAVRASLARLDADGIAVWTLGERTIGGLKMPMIRICREINEFFGMSAVAQIDRRIQSKRMPHRNSVCMTMVSESLLVMTKESST